MSRHLLHLFILLFLAFSVWGTPAYSAAFEVTDIKVSVKAENAVKAKDLAITKAQRIAFAAIIGRTEQQITSVADNQIARLVRGFSVKGENSAARSYTANFTIRFNPGFTHNFAAMQGYEILPQARQETIRVDSNGTATADKSNGNTVENPETAPVQNGYMVLPILDIGSRKILWDEPNPWRDAWQRETNITSNELVNLPIGDISDVSDIPDTAFLDGKPANIRSMLERYNASKIYAITARNQTTRIGMASEIVLSLYKHDGNQLVFVGKTVLRPRSGYLFDDAVPAAIKMIQAAESGQPFANASAPSQMPTMVQNSGRSASITVTVPYQSLQQWVAIQHRLRLVQGVTGIIPIKVSPSSAQVRINTTVTNATDLRRNMQNQGFDIGKLPNGEMVLTEK